MRRFIAILLPVLWTSGICAQGQDATLDIGTVELPGHIKVQEVQVHCADLLLAQPASCAHGSFSARLPGFGKIAGSLQGRFDDAANWQARIAVTRRGIELAGLQKLAAAFSVAAPGTASGKADVVLNAALSPAGTEATLELDSAALNYSEASGRYAAEKLAAHVVLRWSSASRHWNLALDARGGQIYIEPVFLDFAALPLRAEIAARQTADGWQLERLQAQQGKAGTLLASGQLGRDFKPRTLDVSIDAADLAPMVASDLLPFLIGTRLDGLSAGGGARLRIGLRESKPAMLSAVLDEVTLDAAKLGLSVRGVSGALNWAQTNAAPSTLRWRAGAAVKVPFDSSQIAFRAQGRDFELLSPWRQPLLDGALKVQRLALHGLGSNQLSADFSGALEPIQLSRLCKALGWPEFGGTLGGSLPGLSLRDDVWSVSGALEAQAFDGSIRLDQLRAIEPFGVLPRVTANIQMRRLDLERLTSVFTFGRITGRLDGDVSGLRLLAWKPVAFDGRIYSTPGDDTRRRISQRAIDSISSIGGGPTGLLSRGFMSFFEDFAYDRIGIRCVLRDNRCQMDGIAPADVKDGQQGYYLVKGRLLPRIDVVGYAHTVSWDTLLQQIKAAQASGGPQSQPPSPP